MNMTMEVLFRQYPYAEDFFANFSLQPDLKSTVGLFFTSLPEEVCEDLGMSHLQLGEQFLSYLDHMQRLRNQREEIHSITILGGYNKDGAPEESCLTIHAGEIVSIVGATGSGKSRLLADIEWLAQRDTPTKRAILLNGQPPEAARRFSVENKLVAQLSQNMNFIMDLTVAEFINMHAESRMVEQVDKVTSHIIAKANELTGEKFLPATPVTALSGGQSRALMIADAAFLSTCPIVLIDELENAGIDRRQALRLLVDRQKIVLMATHDPILALMGERRIVIKNGAIDRIIETSRQERQHLLVLEKMDQQMTAVREALRKGEQLAGTFSTMAEQNTE
jgi:ABC-type lipoprotein export system ATPase subunit